MACTPGRDTVNKEDCQAAVLQLLPPGQTPGGKPSCQPVSTWRSGSKYFGICAGMPTSDTDGTGTGKKFPVGTSKADRCNAPWSGGPTDIRCRWGLYAVEVNNEDVPPGCSTDRGGGYTAHWNTHATGGNKGKA